MKAGILTYGDQSIGYSIVTSKTLEKRVLIHVHPNGLVEVETPQISTILEIQQAVRK